MSKDSYLKRYIELKKRYKDPDPYGNKPDYYIEYCKALNNHAKDIKNPNNISFILENNGKNGISIESNENKFKLKSDQFGFSFAGISAKKHHPYDAYLLLFGDEELEGNDQNSPLCKVEHWITETRRVGGSFLWPIKNGKNNEYNVARGGVCNYGRKKRGSSLTKKKGDIYIEYYIQDRVDLTLLEIKEIYESNILKIEKISSKERKKIYNGEEIVLEFDNTNIVNKEKLKKNNLMACLFSVKGSPTITYEFLSIFGKDERGFKNYVDYFAFNDFVSPDYKNIIDIYNDSNKNIDNRVNLIRKFNGEINDYTRAKLIGDRHKTDYSSSTSIKEFEYMFDSLVNLINKRRDRLGLSKSNNK